MLIRPATKGQRYSQGSSRRRGGSLARVLTEPRRHLDDFVHVSPSVFETPFWTLRGQCRGWKLLSADGGGWPEAVPLEEPGCVVGSAELDERLTELLDGVEGPNPEQVLLEGADEALGAAVAFWRADEGGELSMPRKASSCWKASDMYWLPWSWRTARPWATFLANAPKLCRTPWRIGSSASKRVARRAAWMPTHSALWWSTAMNTAACPSPVHVVVRSVPHLWTPPSGQGKTSGWSLRVVGCCHLSGLWCDGKPPRACMGVRGPGPDHIGRAGCTVGHPGCPDPVSPTVAPYLPSARPTPPRSWRAYAAGTGAL